MFLRTRENLPVTLDCCMYSARRFGSANDDGKVPIRLFARMSKYVSVEDDSHVGNVPRSDTR